MAYRPEWDQGSAQGGGGGFQFGRSGPWNITKTLLVACVATTFLAILISNATQFNLLRVIGLSKSNAWWLFPFVTYIFPHDTEGLMHLIFNCLMLHFLGSGLEAELGRRRYLTLFFGAGLIGAVAYVLMQVIFPIGNAPVVGASGAILGLLFYIAWATPNRVFIFFIVPVRARTLAYIYLALDLFPIVMHLGQSTGVAHACHLGGALFGYLFYKFQWDPLSGFRSLRDEYRRRNQQRQLQQEASDDEEQDRILKKISTQGMPSLSPAERKFLMDRSQRLRRDDD